MPNITATIAPPNTPDAISAPLREGAPELHPARRVHSRDRARRCFLAAFAILLWMAAGVASRAQTFLFDFGGANTTEKGAAPDDPEFYWNNVALSVGGSATGQLLKLVTAQNLATDANFVIVSPFNGVNENGTLDATVFPADATRDSFYGNTEAFNGQSNVTPKFKLTGLDKAAVYHFTFYASRLGVTDNRETSYAVDGANSGSAALDVANNVDTAVSVSGIKPDPAGEILVSLTPTANNNNGNHFIYLGAMKVEAVPPQVPIVFTQQPASQKIVEFRSVTFTAAVTGSPPYFIQWFSNGSPIPEANAFSYSIPSVTRDLDGTRFSVTVSNLAFSVTSSNAVLQISTDTNAPVLLSAASLDGQNIELSFNEALDPTSAADASSYVVNNGSVAVSGARLRPDGMTVTVTLDARVTGTFTVEANKVTDLVGNRILSGARASGQVPGPRPPSFLFDFGGGSATENGPAPDDPANFWNNVPASLGGSPTGELPNLVTTQNAPTAIGLVMVSPFNGANENGTLASNLFPADATRDSLFGNTEVFNGLSDVTPIFKLTGLDRTLAYNFTFYASRTGVTDNRETGYTVTGATSGFAALNVSNNVTNTVAVPGIKPDTAGEITISLAPTARNNNANHFVYLGVMKMEPAIDAPRFLAPVLQSGQFTLAWTGAGQLEWAPSVAGPWTRVAPGLSSTHSENIAGGASRFFRLNGNP